MVNTYSKKRDGQKYLSTNFKVSEFACKDGSDKILIDDNLVDILQKVRTHFGKPVNISSAYRSASYNRRVGGSSSSYHTKGMAADINIVGVSAVEIGYYIQTIARGVGVYYYNTTNFVHVDTRPSKTYWLCAKAGVYEYYHTPLMPTIGISINKTKRSAIKFIQKKLGLSIDGIFGAGTEKAVKDFQSKNGLTVDGKVGPNTWKKMFFR